MNKERDFDVEELGTASVETKGLPQGTSEFIAGHVPNGISDDD